jgi:hypothetical protein
MSVDGMGVRERDWRSPAIDAKRLGGRPITVVSREYQGESPHGGIVEWEEEQCSICYKIREEE